MASDADVNVAAAKALMYATTEEERAQIAAHKSLLLLWHAGQAALR
jgi:hypothetical protein